MKLIVSPHKIEIEKSPINEKEIDITKVEFEFKDIPENYVKDAYFTYNGTSYKVLIENNECSIPYEVLNKQGQVEIGVVAYLVESEEEIKRYNPSPVYINTLVGSLKEKFENTEPITPSDKEQMEQAIQDMETKVDNLDIEASKSGDTTTITITKKDGTQETTEINDGVDGKDGADFQYNWVGTSLGVKTSEEPNYQYVNLKGDKGDVGSIKILIVNELPSVGDEDTIYLVPYQEAETGNIYKEYIYVNNTWEELGSIPVEVDLSDYYTKSEVNNLIPTQLSSLQDDTTHRLVSDSEKSTWNNKSDFSGNYNDLTNKPDLTNYVKNTDYASSSTAGVINTGGSYGFGVNASGNLYVGADSYSIYQIRGNLFAISKGTLENVITGKDLTTKTYVDGLVGDINTALDTINGEIL